MNSPAENNALKQTLLYSLIVSVIIGAAYGLFVVLRGTWNWYEIRIVFTTIAIALGSILGLACDLARIPRTINLLPRTGVLLTFVGTALSLFGIWAELLMRGDFGVWYFRILAVVIAFTLATVHTCLLSIARLPGIFRYVFYVTSQIIFGLATLVAAMILFEFFDETMFRVLISLSIVAVALTLIIPLLHRICKTRDASNPVKLASLATPLEKRNLAAIDDEIASLRKRLTQLEKMRLDFQSN